MEIAAVRAVTSRPFGINLYPTRDEADEAAIAALCAQPA